MGLHKENEMMLMKTNNLLFGMIVLALLLFASSVQAGIQYGSPVDIFTSEDIGTQSRYSPPSSCSFSAGVWTDVQVPTWHKVDLDGDGRVDVRLAVNMGSSPNFDSQQTRAYGLNSDTQVHFLVSTATDSVGKNEPFDESAYTSSTVTAPACSGSDSDWYAVKTTSLSGIRRDYKIKSIPCGTSLISGGCGTQFIKTPTWRYPVTVDEPFIVFVARPVTLDDGLDSRYDIQVRALDLTNNVTDGTEQFYEFNKTFDTETTHRYALLGEVADTVASGGLSFDASGTHSRNYDFCAEEILRFDSGGNTSYREKDDIVDNLILQATGIVTPDSSIVVYNNPNTRYFWTKKTESSCDIQTNYTDTNSFFCTADNMDGASLCVYDTFKKQAIELTINSCSGNAQHNFTWDVSMPNTDQYCDFFDTPTLDFASQQVSLGYEYNVTNDAYKINETLGEEHQFFMSISNDFGAFGTGSAEFEITGTTSYATCEAQYFCTPYTDCQDVGGGIELRSRTCTNTNYCPFGDAPVETQFCNAENLPPEPDAFVLVPTIQFPETNNNPPNLDSQAMTGFGCFTNWYNYSDDRIQRMDYYIDNELIQSLTPDETPPVCELGTDCSKSRGYVQTWDYIDNYFTEYEDQTISLSVFCYDENNTQYPYNLNITVGDPNKCDGDADTSKKECFAYDEHIGNLWHYATDINARPDNYTRMQRLDLIENKPDKQKLRLTTDVVNYWFDTNDALDNFGNIDSNAGYQIWKAFDEPQERSQIYFDMMITDSSPKFVIFAGSSPTLHAEAMLVMYRNKVYYYDGFGLNYLGNYRQNIPYTFEVDIDIPNNRIKVGQRTWDMFAVGENTIYNWRRIGDWDTNKIGTLIHSDSGHDNIQYVAFTMMGDSCDSDVNCIDRQLQTKFYGGSGDATTTAFPSFDGEDGWKSNAYADGVPDGVYAKYYNDEGKLTGGGGSNFGLLTFGFDPESAGIQFENGSQLTVKYKVSTSVGCAGNVDRNLTIEIWNITLGDKSTLFNGSIAGTGEQSFEITDPFDTVYLTTRIVGGVCLASRGNIGIDSIEIINNTGSNLGVRTCRNYDYFLETFDDVAPYTELNASFNQSLDNADFMLEWNGLDTAFSEMSLDFDNERGYCYSEVMIDNLESFENTRSSFGDTVFLADESNEQNFQYEWLARLGWIQNCADNSDYSYPENQSYQSVCYDWSVCTEHGLNRGTWCILSIHFSVGLELIQEWIFDNFLLFIVLLTLLIMLAYATHMT